MKRDSARVIAEYLALVEKRDQGALIDFVARHPEELGSLSLSTAKPVRQPSPTDRRTAILEVIGLFVIVLFSLAFVAAHVLSLPVDRSRSPVAILAQANGTVELLAAGAPDDAGWQPAQAGASIQIGDSVRTGPDSTAQLTFPDGSMTGLEPGTEVAVARVDFPQAGGAPIVVLEQRLGQTYNRIQPSPDQSQHFKIETPTAVSAVRGTEFIVDVGSSGATHIVVIEGVVDVTAQEVTAEVLASQETTVEPAHSPTAAQPASIPSSSFSFTPEPSADIQATQMLGQTEAPQPAKLKATNTPKPAHTPKLTNTPKPTNTPRSVNTHKPTKEPQPTKTPKP